MRDDRDYKVRGFSESDSGRGVTVNATTSPGTLIHTALTSPAANEWDEITLQAVNNTGSAVSLTVEAGGNTTADRITVSIPANSGLTTVLSELVLNGGVPLRAYASTASAVTVFGFLRRYEQEGR
ncbi:MAG: hypothetical protein AAF653_09930 [Chloroflexota bacterium]